MQKCIIGKKIGMTQLFDEKGNVVPVTVVEAGPCVVVQKKTIENDGYEAVQIGFGALSDKRATKAIKGHFAKADVALKKTLKEFRLDDIAALNVGDIIKADTFAAGDAVDVCGTSKGKGYAGVIKRFNAHSLKDTHGTGPVHRHAGSNGACSDPSRVMKGKKLPGHLGAERVTVTGNPFDGSSEPGIVWVMQDENGDGLPNDTWYELKGSEYGKEETIRDYAVTYYRPSAPKMNVAWTDNRGSGVIEYLEAFHQQDYYYPAWVEADSYTLRGPCLKSRSYDASGNGTYWVNPAFDWGYADNFSPIDRLTDDDNYNAAPADNHFKISNAVTFDGKDANLKYVDFVKIQVALNTQCGWIGEVSTEVFGVKDFNMTK